MNSDLEIRKASPKDHDAIWEIIQPIIAKGDTYAFHPHTSREDMLALWCGKDKHTYVAQRAGKIVGTFMLKDNHPGLGSHVANAGYMTHPDEYGKGIGRTMAEFSLVEAKRLGYTDMQFNLVVKSNVRAVKLWQHLGFEIIGEIPNAFQHAEQGLVNAYIMWRRL